MTSASDIPLLLDTSVLSSFFKRRDTRKHLYLPHLQDKVLAISFVTVGEMYRWAIERRWGLAKVQTLQATFDHMTILPYHDSVALNWARIQTSTPKSDNDALVAACTLTYGCVLVTDDKDFEDIHGLSIISHHSEGRL